MNFITFNTHSFDEEHKLVGNTSIKVEEIVYLKDVCNTNNEWYLEIRVKTGQVFYVNGTVYDAIKSIKELIVKE